MDQHESDSRFPRPCQANPKSNDATSQRRRGYDPPATGTGTIWARRSLLKGEVKHPGTYGIRPGRAIEFRPGAGRGFFAGCLPVWRDSGARASAELETKEQDKLILRVKDAEGSLQNLPETTPAQKQAKEMALAQYQTTLDGIEHQSARGARRHSNFLSY